MELILTTRISVLIKTKAKSILFVCGEKLQFTSITDAINFHNSAIKLLSHFYDIRVDVQEKAKRNPLKRDRKRKKKHKPRAQSLFEASVTSIQDGNHSLIFKASINK